jgi:hypothetical protein
MLEGLQIALRVVRGSLFPSRVGYLPPTGPGALFTAHGYPHLFRFKLELASAPRGKSDCIFLSIIARSFLAHKKQNGLD